MYPFSSSSSSSTKTSVLGLWPMATNTPSVLNRVVSPVSVSSRVTASTALSPCISVTIEFQMTSTFSLSSARVAMIRDALNSSRRWTMVTFEANLVRNSASSIAVSPPPTTTSS